MTPETFTDIEAPSNGLPASYDGAEWLALFPHPDGAPPPSPLATAASPAVPRGPFPALWAAEPLPMAELVRIVRNISPFHGAIVRFQATTAGWAARVLFRNGLVAVSVLSAALLGIWFYLETGLSQRIVGTVTVLLEHLAPMVAVAINSESISAGLGAAGNAEDQNWNPLAVLYRYRMLQLRATDGKPCPLLEHRDMDSHCPCPGPNCAGPVLFPASALGWHHLIAATLFGFSKAMVSWTALVTFGAAFWPTPYGAILGIGCVLFTANVAIFSYVPWLYSQNPKLGCLQQRLRYRASMLALSSLLSAAQHDLLGERADGKRERLTRGDGQLELVLHDSLAASWKYDFNSLTSWASVFGLNVVVTAIAIVANMAAGSCVPAYPIATLVYVVFVFAHNLVLLASYNSDVDVISELYGSTASLLSRLLASAAAQPNTDPASLRRWQARLEALRPLADGEQLRARFLGTEIGYGALRAVAATAFTAAVGMFGIFRPLGIRVTMDVACVVG
ncbi:hypothetical protein DFJ74DRAFT_358108 [Hyaloraphidium curvatum]|nr:hypothetical protein DFJ74DRAFT_358108 [Hyaloraphidium curvatum]